MKNMDDQFEDENCGHCLHHKKDNELWICSNVDSEYYGSYTEYNERCCEFEERQISNPLQLQVVSRKNSKKVLYFQE